MQTACIHLLANILLYKVWQDHHSSVADGTAEKQVVCCNGLVILTAMKSYFKGISLKC